MAEEVRPDNSTATSPRPPEAKRLANFLKPIASSGQNMGSFALYFTKQAREVLRPGQRPDAPLPPNLRLAYQAPAPHPP
jgi:hypothetical protein